MPTPVGGMPTPRRATTRGLSSTLMKPLRLDPRNAGTYTFRGHAYYDLGDYARAIADFDVKRCAYIRGLPKPTYCGGMPTTIKATTSGHWPT